MSQPRVRLLLGAAAVALTVLAVLLAGGIGEQKAGSPEAGERGRLVRPRGNATLAEARRFRDFPLYFAGETTAGFRLEAVMRIDRTSPAPHTEFSFIYGACRSIRGQACSPPLTVLLWPACYRYETRYSIPARERKDIRDVPARTSRQSRRVELYPADTTIIIDGGGLRSDAQLVEVARRLRGLNVTQAPSASLPARPPHAGHTIKCRSTS